MVVPVLHDFFSATPAFAAGQDSPRAYLERCLARLQDREPQVGAFVHLNLEGARAAADKSNARWQQGQPLSPVDGMPIGIKDIIETVDMPTEMGSPLFKGWRSGRDAAVVAALREAGAVIVGKTVTTEFAAMEPRGTRNPWDLQRTPGGSSSGSAAAVGGGFLPAGLGTQALGSIVRPASYCGCFGYKPSVGALNRGGSHDGLSQSCTGVLAASLEDAWNVTYAIAARAGGDPGCPGFLGAAQRPSPRAPRTVVMLQTAGWDIASATAKEQLCKAIARMQAQGVRVLGRQDNPRIAAIETAILPSAPLSTEINSWEWRWPLNVYRQRQADGLGQFMRDRLIRAEAMTLDEYRAAIAERARIRAAYAALAEIGDVIVTLAAPGPAPLGLQATGNAAFNAPASLLGTPALSLPLLAEEGLPLGLQVMGFEGRDTDVFATAGWIQDLLGHHPAPAAARHVTAPV